MVLIPKGNREFIGIGLIEVLCKALLGVINRRIGEAVQFNDVLHGLLVGQGAGTASLEAKFSRSQRKRGRRFFMKYYSICGRNMMH